MANEIIIKKKFEPGNDASDVDAIGARFAKIPYDIFLRINALREFDWILESPYPDMPNWGIAKFIELNPQFFVTAFDKFDRLKQYPRIVVNKDGTIYDLKEQKWLSNKKKGHYGGK